MKFNLKIFVLVGVFAGFRDVCGTEDECENKDYGDFIVEGLGENEKKELEAAVREKRVIKAVYTTGYGGDVSIIHGNFGKNLSKVFVRAGKGKNGVKEVDNFVANSAGRLVHNMQEKVEYTVYFIFNNESFNSKSEGLLVSTALMFDWCTSLIHADLRFFNTTNVTDMFEMFGYCSSLKELNLSPSNTTSVENMSYMFNGCTALTELDLSPFDTKNVTNMRGMFYFCTALTELDLSKFDTKKVTNMSFMFSGCSALTKLDLSNFNTKKVTNMSFMFSGCSALTKLDLSNFNTKNVTDMYHMFNGCIVLRELNLSKFDFSSVNDMREIFQWCDLNNLYLPKKYKDIRKRRICCGDRYVYINGKAVVEFNPKKVTFVVDVQDDLIGS